MGGVKFSGENVFIRLFCGNDCGVFFLINDDVGGFSLLYIFLFSVCWFWVDKRVDWVSYGELISK